MSSYLHTAIEDAQAFELTRAASGGRQGSPVAPAPAPGAAPAPPPAPRAPADAAAQRDAVAVREHIKTVARTRARTARSIDPASRFYRRLVDFYLRDYLAAPSPARGVEACERRIGRTFAGPATPGDSWEEGALAAWNRQQIPAAARALRPALPAELAAATDILSRPNRAVLPFIDVPHLIGGSNTGTGADADVSGGGRNISQLMHWGTGVKYSNVDRLAMRELFIAYELWHLEAWDVFGEDPINDLIAEEAGRILGTQLRAGTITSANLRQRLEEGFAEARAWVGTLLRARLSELDQWTVAERQRPANIWWGAQPAMNVWGNDTIYSLLRGGMSVEAVRRHPLVERITEIYTLVYEADAWEAARGRIDNGTFIPAILRGEYNRQFERMARGQPMISLPWGLETAEALDQPIEGYRYENAGTTCSGGPAPGAVGLRDELARRFGGRGEIYNCRPVRGGQRLSLHAEGRAVDWYRRASDPAEAAEAQRIIDWLLGTDAAGNAHAVARRMGVQEIIWNRRIWTANRAAEGWRAYGGVNPHTDHLHIGLNRAGAARQTSYWTAPPPAAAPSAPVTSMPPQSQALSGGPPPASDLTWQGGTAAQLAFKRRVYEIHCARSARSRAFVANVPDADLAAIPGSGQRMRTAAAAACGRMLAEAATALADAKARSDTLALAAEPLAAGSGYRSVTQQFTSWNRNFQNYYDQTRTQRAAAPGGEHGEQAAELTARHIGGVLGAPGFSLHNNGLAIDLTSRQGATRLGASTAQRGAWRSSWAWSWLTANAARFDFFQNTAIDEPWHWEYRPPAGTAAPPATAAPVTSMPRSSALGAVAAGEHAVDRLPLLAEHHDRGPDMILRWNAMADPAAGVDVVVHLHGFSSDRHLQLETNKLPISGLDFAPPTAPAALRAPAHPAWSGRSRPTLAVLPRGRARPGHPAAYDFPALVTAQGFASLVDAALRTFESRVGAAAGTVRPRRIVVTAHSGGGSPLNAILGRTAGTPLDPHEVHVFDALYGTPSGLRAWVERRLRADVARLGAQPAADLGADGGALRVLYLPARPGINPATGRPYVSTEPGSVQIRDAVRALIPAGRPYTAALERRWRVERAAVGHALIGYWYGGRLLADVSTNVAAP